VVDRENPRGRAGRSGPGSLCLHGRAGAWRWRSPGPGGTGEPAPGTGAPCRGMAPTLGPATRVGVPRHQVHPGEQATARRGPGRSAVTGHGGVIGAPARRAGGPSGGQQAARERKTVFRTRRPAPGIGRARAATSDYYEVGEQGPSCDGRLGRKHRPDSRTDNGGPPACVQATVEPASQVLAHLSTTSM